MRQPSTSAGAPVSFACDASTSSSTRAASTPSRCEIGAPARAHAVGERLLRVGAVDDRRTATAASGAARARCRRPRRARRAPPGRPARGGTRGSIGAPRGTRAAVAASSSEQVLVRRRARARGTSPRGTTSASSPRTIATGMPAALPITSSAAAAISSATATSVTCRMRPSASGVSRRSTTAAIPLTPIATSVRPRRHGRPNVSETTTATSTPRAARSASRMCFAERSGSTGSSAACPASTFERSMPALAHTKPCRVSLITRSPRRRTMRTDSDSTSRWRAVDVVGVEVDEPALGLRHDLLRHDEAVAVVERRALRVRGRRR